MSLYASIYTRARIAEDSGVDPTHPHLVIFRQHGTSEAMWFTSLDMLALWIAEMTPDELTAHTAGVSRGDAHADELIAHYRRGVGVH